MGVEAVPKQSFMKSNMLRWIHLMPYLKKGAFSQHGREPDNLTQCSSWQCKGNLKDCCCWRMRSSIILGPCIFPVFLNDFQGFWLVLLMCHIISCMETEKEIVDQHYNGADTKPYKSITAQRSHEKEICCNRQGWKPRDKWNTPNLWCPLLRQKHRNPHGPQDPKRNSDGITNPTIGVQSPVS